MFDAFEIDCVELLGCVMFGFVAVGYGRWFFVWNSRVNCCETTKRITICLLLWVDGGMSSDMLDLGKYGYGGYGWVQIRVGVVDTGGNGCESIPRFTNQLKLNI